MRNVLDDKYDDTNSPPMERRRSSKYRAPPTYDEFKNRYTEDEDEYESGWPGAEGGGSRRSSSRPSTIDRRYSKDHIYSNDRYNDDDNKYRGYDARYHDDHHRRGSGYDRLSNRGSDVSNEGSQDSKVKLATNV